MLVGWLVRSANRLIPCGCSRSCEDCCSWHASTPAEVQWTPDLDTICDARQARLNDCLQLSGRGSSFGYFETGAMGIIVRQSALLIGSCYFTKPSIGACATHEKRYLNTARVIYSLTVGNLANGTAKILGILESQMRRYFCRPRSKE